jgi:hypothetical protein
VTKAGPKQAVDASPLPFRTTATGARRFAKFCQRFITVPEGEGALGRLVLRQWQVELVASVWDAAPLPRLAGWMLPRGQGKTTLVAALGLWVLLGAPGARVVVAAVDERQASLAFAAAARWSSWSPSWNAACRSTPTSSGSRPAGRRSGRCRRSPGAWRA